MIPEIKIFGGEASVAIINAAGDSGDALSPPPPLPPARVLEERSS